MQTRFKSLIAVLIAAVTVLGAIAACRASVAGSSAADADFEGVSAAIKAERADIVNKITAYEHYRAFASYDRYEETGNLLYDESAATTEASTAQELEAKQKEAWGLADSIKWSFFPPRYIDVETGQYNIQRELDESWAESTQNDDLDPTPHFNSSDALRRRSLFLTADMIVFAVAFWFLTLASTIENKLKYVVALLGILAALAGILGIFIGEVLI